MGAIGIPVKLQKFAKRWSDLGAEEVRVTLEPLPHRLLEGQGPRLTDRRHVWRRRQRASVGKISAECCSFSAVSAPIFASKYAFCSIFQNLPDSQAEIFEI